MDIVCCKANLQTVCVAKQIRGVRELGMHAKQELCWQRRESIQRDGCFAKPGGTLQCRIFFADGGAKFVTEDGSDKFIVSEEEEES